MGDICRFDSDFVNLAWGKMWLANEARTGMADDLFSNPTHPTPPWTEDERLDWLRLIRSRRVGAVTFHRLLAEHGSARAALDALA